ncbi:MAG: type II toxin-antitoxin system RelE/ParE family toxin [Verrucomicrobia bacterium]|nr:type II toxin-antitoxin system RelE/ParE family toxin [Verrucomicrobiota bacterium]
MAPRSRPARISFCRQIGDVEKWIIPQWGKSNPRKKMKVELTTAALQDLARLPEREAAQILRKIQWLQSGLVGDIKRLTHHDCDYRLRMGDYRILFDLIGDTVLIRAIGNRKEIYD